MKFFEWEDQVCIQIEDALDITRSDAQAILEANETLLYAQWATNTEPRCAVQALLAD